MKKMRFELNKARIEKQTKHINEKKNDIFPAAKKKWKFTQVYSTLF